jgi:hypothetical protein
MTHVKVLYIVKLIRVRVGQQMIHFKMFGIHGFLCIVLVSIMHAVQVIKLIFGDMLLTFSTATRPHGSGCGNSAENNQLFDTLCMPCS